MARKPLDAPAMTDLRFLMFALVSGCMVAPAPVYAPPAAGPVIQLQSASYGANCGVPPDNVLTRVAAECNGRPSCTFRANNAMFGDPAVGCPKDFAAEWTCDGRPFRTAPVNVRPGENNPITLACR